MSQANPLHICRVCGYDNGYPVWGENGEEASFNICVCCGCEFGFHDDTLSNIRAYREKWIKEGKLWFVPKSKPENWTLEEQMKNIPEEFL